MDIVELIKQGKSAKEIKEQTGKGLSTIYRAAEKNGLKITAEKPWDSRDRLIIEYRQQGYGYTKIAKLLNMDKSNLVTRCKRLRLQSNAPQHTKEEQIEKVKQYCDACGFEYLDGYKNRKSYVLIRCKTCGAETEITFGSLQNRGAVCKCCQSIERKKYRTIVLQKQAQEKEERQQIKAKEKEKAKREKKIQAFSTGNAMQISMQTCIQCGALFYGRGRYCSRTCLKRAAYRRKDHVRRIRTTSRAHDTDITLRQVYDRDGGICYLCGSVCDWNDYTMNGETFIAGDLYPSIDHVIALASGGTHEWGNVRLAHRICNSIKSNT